MRSLGVFLSVLFLSVTGIVLFCSLHPAPETVRLTHTLPDKILNEEEKEFGITLNKGNLSGPARIRIEIRQAGMEVSGIELAGSEILKEGDVHSIVWTDLPSTPSIDLRLKLKAHKFFTGIYTARISFSYLEEGSSKEIQLGTHDIRMSSSGKSIASTGNKPKNTGGTGSQTGNTSGTGGTASTEGTAGTTNTTNSGTQTGTSTETGTSGTTTGTQTGTTGTQTGTTQSGNTGTMIDPITKKPGTPIQDASTIPGLFFRVQVAASHFLVTQEYFSDRYKFDEQLYVDKVDGWIKYTIGDFKTVEEALAKKATLTSYPFKGPFLVAFNDGKRIPLFTARQMSAYKRYLGINFLSLEDQCSASEHTCSFSLCLEP